MKNKMAMIFRVTRDAAALVGLAAAAGFFWQERSPLWLALAVLLAAGIWYTVYQIHRGGAGQVRKPSSRREPPKGHRDLLPADTYTGKMRRRFQYFDAASGEDVYKMEPVA